MNSTERKMSTVELKTKENVDLTRFIFNLNSSFSMFELTLIIKENCFKR